MRIRRCVAWGLLVALLVAFGCARGPGGREGEAAAGPAEGVAPKLLPTGRDDGIKAENLIRGKVTAVDRMLGIVVINVGERNGVKSRYGFTVYRGEKFVGKIVVEEVFPDMSSARYGRTMKTHVNVGDEVTTKLGVEL